MTLPTAKQISKQYQNYCEKRTKHLREKICIFMELYLENKKEFHIGNSAYFYFEIDLEHYHEFERLLNELKNLGYGFLVVPSSQENYKQLKIMW